jgi:hypothetical protein
MRFGTTWRADGLLREGVILSHWRGQRWKRCRRAAWSLWRQFAGRSLRKCPIAGPDPAHSVACGLWGEFGVRLVQKCPIAGPDPVHSGKCSLVILKSKPKTYTETKEENISTSASLALKMRTSDLTKLAVVQ